MSDPEYIPVARAVVSSDVPFTDFPATAAVVSYASVSPATMRPRRAILELLMMLPVAIAGASVVYIVHARWRFIDTQWLNALSTIPMGIAVLAYIKLVLWLDGHRGETIGWTARQLWRNVGIGLGTFVLAYIYAFLMVLVLAGLAPEFFSEEPVAQKVIEQTFPKMKLWHMLLMMTFVAVWEEIAFRGFLLTRLKVVLRHWWLTVPAGALVFGLIHFYQGVAAVGIIAAMGFIMGLLFVWRKSLAPSIAFHFANNMVMLQILRWVSSDW